MRKKFLTAFLAVTVAVSLSACGSGSGNSTPASVTPVEETPVTEAADEEPALAEDTYDDDGYFTDELIDMLSSGEITIEMLEEMVATGEVGYETYEEVLSIYESIKPVTNFWDYPELNNTTRDMKIVDALSFSEGVAWITVAEQSGNNRCIMLINTSGEVLYFTKLETNDYEYTNFHNGVSLLSLDEDVFLVNTEGKVVWSMQDDGIKSFEEVYGAGCVESIEIVYRYDRHRHYNDGEFPTKNFCGYIALEAKINTFAKTGSVYTMIKPDGTMLCNLVESLSFYSEDGYYKCDDLIINLLTGETTTDPDIAKQWTQEYMRSYCNGLLFDRNLRGYTDDTGNVRIDCSNYNFWSIEAPEFCNGYCVLPIKNPDGAPYLTVIDMDGNQLFAPIKLPEKSNRYLNGMTYCYGYASEKYIVLTNDCCPIFYQNANPGGNWAEPLGIYITLEGEVIDSGYNSVYPFSDGYSLVYKYDSTGTSYYFLNADLEDAFLQSGAVKSNESIGATGQSSGAVEKTYITMNNFSIEGKWKSVGSYGFGQAQPGAIVAFDGTNCNFFSPSDTYAFYADSDGYRLECTSFMSTSTAAFTVKIIDTDHIDVYYGDNVTELQRTE